MRKQYPEEFKKQVTAICLAGTPFLTVSKSITYTAVLLSTYFHEE